MNGKNIYLGSMFTSMKSYITNPWEIFPVEDEIKNGANGFYKITKRLQVKKTDSTINLEKRQKYLHRLKTLTIFLLNNLPNPQEEAEQIFYRVSFVWNGNVTLITETMLFEVAEKIHKVQWSQGNNVAIHFRKVHEYILKGIPYV